MKCDRCENEATVHEVRIKSGKRLETHLCEQCAREQGMSVQTPAPITQLLTQYITSEMHATPDAPAASGSGPAAPPANTACPACGTTYAQFRNTGLLGCAECYAAFEMQLGPLLARAHEGGTHHVGKTPKSFTPSATAPKPAVPAPAPPAKPTTAVPNPSGAVRIAALKRELDQAVAAEKYEQAAKLRDELARLQAAPKPTRAKRTTREPREDRDKPTEGRS